ncbi:MAG: hypothetical protein Q8J69_06565 [Sphingobacteriaceae bacterium]|nr:hypothetical protein [Sphingobacteriaceae bacterium]
MKKALLLQLSLALVLLSSCAKNIHVNYQSDSANTGKVVLKPAEPTNRTYVTFNDSLLVNKKYVKSVTIHNVPSGEHHVHYTSNNYAYKEKIDGKMTVNVDNNRVITKLIEVPPYSAGYWIGLLISLPILVFVL